MSDEMIDVKLWVTKNCNAYFSANPTFTPKVRGIIWEGFIKMKKSDYMSVKATDEIEWS